MLETTWESINELEADKEFPEVVICIWQGNNWSNESRAVKLLSQLRRTFGDDASEDRADIGEFNAGLETCSLINLFLINSFAFLIVLHSPSPSILIV